MSGNFDDSVRKTDLMIGEMEKMIAKSRAEAARKSIPSIDRARMESLGDQMEAILGTARKYRAWMKIQAIVKSLEAPLKTLAEHLEVAAAGKVLEAAQSLQKFGEEEICPWKDLESILENVDGKEGGHHGRG